MYHFSTHQKKKKERRGRAAPTHFSVSIDPESKVSDEINIKDTFLNELLDETGG